MRGNLVNTATVISTKHAAKFLNVSYNALIREIDATPSNEGTICWQARIADADNTRPILGFSREYLNEVSATLGKNRKRGKQLFPPEVKLKMERINKKWRGTD